jgi:uncharacterized membrane protein
MSVLPGISRNGTAGPDDPVARGLGAFSFALGVPQVVAPGRMSRMIGVKDDAVSRAWMRAVGVREIVAGTGIFTTRRPNGWVWARVAGDTIDLALLASALRGRSKQQGRTLAATGAVIGALAADVIDGVRLQRASGNGGPGGAADEPMHVKAALTVRRGRDEVYAMWRDFERFPSFMAHLEDVRSTGSKRSHWKARGPLGRSVEWDAEITEDVPGERIAWRSLVGSKLPNSGTVRFTDAPGGQGTEVHVELRYEVPGGAVGTTLARLFGEEPAIGVRDDLRRFKQIAETGEVVRSDGAPEGQLGRRQVKPRPATPLRDKDLAAAGIATGGTS